MWKCSLALTRTISPEANTRPPLLRYLGLLHLVRRVTLTGLPLGTFREILGKWTLRLVLPTLVLERLWTLGEFLAKWMNSTTCPRRNLKQRQLRIHLNRNVEKWRQTFEGQSHVVIRIRCYVFTVLDLWQKLSNVVYNLRCHQIRDLQPLPLMLSLIV